MTRRNWLLLLPLLALFHPPVAGAQSPVMAIPQVHVALWPDYDRPAVLVMVTGELGSDAELPAVLALPFPDGASLNAVARIDEGGAMLADVPYQTGSGQLTLTTQSPRFRVEYYVPYRVEGDQRSFTFSWQAALPVERMDVLVQRPVAAGSLSTQPEAASVGPGQDGLVYHALPPQVVPAGRSFSVRVSYPMANPRLSVVSESDVGGTGPLAAPASASPAGWQQLAAVIGVVLVAVAITWRLARGAAAKEPRAPGRAEGGPAPRFCQACGKPLAAGVRFCSQCGEAVRKG